MIEFYQFHLIIFYQFYYSIYSTDITKHLNIQLLPENFIEYAEKYINKIEEKMKKRRVKAKKIYTFRQGTLEGYPNL